MHETGASRIMTVFQRWQVWKITREHPCRKSKSLHRHVKVHVLRANCTLLLRLQLKRHAASVQS